MKKSRMKLTNYVSPAKWNKIKLSHIPNITTNYCIPPVIFERECKEYDAGILPNEHELYLCERYA